VTLPTPPPAPTCPRHPTREAWRACTRCGRVWCNDCLISASVGSQCVDCVKAGQPPARERIRRSMATRLFPVTKAMVAINVAVFVVMVAFDSNVLNGRIGGRDSAYVDLALNRLFIAEGEWWRLVTSGFIHFGIIHLGFNCYALWNVGQMIEPLIGSRRFILLYFGSLMAGSAGVLLLERSFGLTGGASGAVFGLFGAAAVAMRHQGINPFRTQLGMVLIINLVLTFGISGISIGGHLGGLVGGAICGAVLTAPKWRRIPEAATWGIPMLLIVVSVAISFAVSRV
jgi:membrane associated rhomboid family serine protease